MRKTIFLGVLLLLVAFSQSAWASVRVGFVNVQEVMVASEAGKRAAEEFKRTFDKEREIIQAREAELKRMRDDLDRQRSVLTESVLREREAAYQRRFREYQNLVREANEALQQRDQELTRTLMPEVLKVINALGEREKFTMIIDYSAIPLPYFSRELDITRRVIDELNRTLRPPPPARK
jgi:outer membrane protein